jgi:hypothetical protein
LKLHVRFSVATFAAEICVFVVARELERSKLWAGHESPRAVTSGGGCPTVGPADELRAKVAATVATPRVRRL